MKLEALAPRTGQRAGSGEWMRQARASGSVVPAFNIPYLPMVEPVVAALRDAQCRGFLAVARLELVKFEAKSMRAVKEEYERFKDERFTRLHMDHVPVLDEDGIWIDYEGEIREALELGYDSVMVDGSRLPLEDNIRATRRIVELAGARGIPVESELGAVLGHSDGPLPSYEELFAGGVGFTDPADAERFVKETGTDWLSVAAGSIHGAVSAARRDEAKVPARLDIPRLASISQRTGVPLVLHGGSGIPKAMILESVRHGIAKINIGTAIRQPYERAAGPVAAAQAVYDAVRTVLRHDLDLSGRSNPNFTAPL